jgi:hypothetical protein
MPRKSSEAAEVEGFSPENVATVIAEAPEGSAVVAASEVPYEGLKPGTVQEFDNGLTLMTN